MYARTVCNGSCAQSCKKTSIDLTSVVDLSVLYLFAILFHCLSLRVVVCSSGCVQRLASLSKLGVGKWPSVPCTELKSEEDNNKRWWYSLQKKKTVLTPLGALCSYEAEAHHKQTTTCSPTTTLDACSGLDKISATKLRPLIPGSVVVCWCARARVCVHRAHQFV